MENKNNNLRLVPQDQQTLTPLMKNEELKKEICLAISSGQCTIPEDLVNLFKITYEQSINLLSDPGFLSQIKKQTMAKLNLSFHTTIPTKLNEIINKGDYKESLAAMKLSAQLTDNLKNTGTENTININLEGLVKEAEKQINRPIIMEAEFNSATSNTEFERKVS